jgi:DnaJ-class molecular chaperone
VSFNYWEECIKEAFEDADITATDEQTETVISWVEGAFENYGLATGSDCIPNPLQTENDELKRELNKEKNKRICEECNGHGRIIIQGPYHSSESECMECRGSGFVS